VSSLRRLRADSLVFGGLILMIVWLPVPWGSHRPWAGPLIGLWSYALIALWLVLAAFGVARLPTSRRLWWPLVAWLLWLGWIGLSVMPGLGDSFGALAPAAADVQRPVAELGLAPLGTMSIGPGITIDSLLLSLSYFGLYWLVVLATFGDEDRMRWVLGAVVVAGFGEALYGSLMLLSGVEYGFFEHKHYYLNNATGTFVNRNHLAGYLELACAAGIGLILADLERRSSRRGGIGQLLRDFVNLLFSNKMRVRLALVAVVIGLVLTRSRMGNIAMFGSMAFCGIAFIVLRERAMAGRAAILFLSILVVDLLIVGKWFGLEAVVERLQQTEMSREERVRVLDQIPAVIEHYAPAGSGLGTFAIAFEPFRNETLKGYYDHAHNDYAEFAVETGFVGLGLVLLLGGIHYLHALRVMIFRARRTPAAVCFAAFMGLTALGIHAMSDFNLQIPANAGTLVIFMALAACCSPRSQRTIMTAASSDERRGSVAAAVE
jgi:putative inorganic carbon (HCO3(-)) transporter